MPSLHHRKRMARVNRDHRSFMALLGRYNVKVVKARKPEAVRMFNRLADRTGRLFLLA